MEFVSKKIIQTVIHEISKKFKSEVDIFLVGSISAVVGYDLSKQTMDVDSYNQLSLEFKKLWVEVTNQLKMNLSISQTTVFFPPDGFESRYILSNLSTDRIRLYFMEKHDFVIAKLSRGIGKDLSDIEQLHKLSSLDADILIDRYLNEYIFVVHSGSQKMKNLDFLEMIEKLFGPKKMKSVEKIFAQKSFT